MRISYNDGSGLVTLAQDFHIQTVPYAWYANSLQGLTAANFVQINPGQNVTQANLENLFAGTNYNTLFNLASGTSTAPLSMNNQQIKNLADPSLAQDAATKNYTDTRVAGSLVNLSGVGAGVGDGRVLAWNATLNQWEAITPSSITDATKLPLAGGTMAGNINMNGQQVLNSGHITLQNLSTITLGKFTSVQEATLVGTLGVGNKGATWYNSTTDRLMYWDGDSAEPVGNSVSVDNITSAALQYFSYMPAGTECLSGEVLKWDAINDRWLCGTDAVGVTAHSGLTGLNADDHPQYVLLTGRAGGQSLQGGTAANGILTLESTSNATKGPVLIQPTTGNVGIGTTNPLATLHVEGTVRAQQVCDELGANCKDISTGWGAGGDIDGIVTAAGSALSGGALSGTATLAVVTDGTTIETNGSNQLQVRDAGVSLAKLAADSVDSSKIANDSIMNADINSAAAIAWSKINKTGAIAGDVGAASVSRAINTNSGSGLSGGGDLSADRNIALNVDNSTVEIATNTLRVRDGGITNAKITSLSVAKISSAAAEYFSYMPAGTECTNNYTLIWDSTTDRWICGALPTTFNHVADADNDTKIQVEESADEDRIRFDTAGTERMIIDAVGNVGVGTNNPGYKLDVNGQMNATQVCVAGDCRSSWPAAGSGNAVPLVTKISASDLPAGSFSALVNFTPDFNSAVINNLGGANLAANRVDIPSDGIYSIIATAYYCPQTSHYTSTAILIDGGTAFLAGSSVASGCRTDYASGVISLTTGQNVSMTLFDSVNGPTAGIGNISLSVVKLNSLGTSVLADLDGDTKLEVERSADDDTLRLATAGSDRLTILSSGSVGIGTTAPSSLLDIAGAVTSRPSGTGAGQAGQFVMRELAAGGTNTLA